jgi:hypothetical protein
MLRCFTGVAVIAAALAATPAASQTCFPVSREVVSLGEANAQGYADRSLDRAIAARKASIRASGRDVGRITRAKLDCAPYPNVLGADEWRCTGRAQVCAAE